MLPQDAHQVNGFAARNTQSSIHPATAFALKTLLEGCAINGEIDAVPAIDKPFIMKMSALKTDDRKMVYDTLKYMYADPDALAKAVFSADGIEPDAEPVEPDVVNIATFAHIKNESGDYKWIWSGWIPDSCLCAIAAHEGIGKTRLSLDLARRIWVGENWPDGQAPSLPPRSKTLWVVSDQNHGETMLAAEELGVPLESMLVNATPENIYSGTDLDDGSTITLLRKRILHHKPALVFIDTLNGSTEKDLCAANSTNQFFKPLKKMAQDAGVTFIINAHLTRFDKLYGKRTGENVRSVIMLTQPDESTPNRRRLETSKTFGKMPPALGITFGDGRLDYDFNPPRKPDDESKRGGSSHGKRGPEPEKLKEAKSWLKGNLATPGRVSMLRKRWEAEGFGTNTIYRARDAMEIEEYIVDGNKWWKLPASDDDDDTPNKDDF